MRLGHRAAIKLVGYTKPLKILIFLEKLFYHNLLSSSKYITLIYLSFDSDYKMMITFLHAFYPYLLRINEYSQQKWTYYYWDVAPNFHVL